MTKTPPLAPADMLALLNQVDQQAEIREFDTHAPLSLPAPDPLEIQLLAHFRTLSAYGKKVAVHQLAAAASLCAAVKKEG